MDSRDKYPIGPHDFRELREGNAIYIDKTPSVEKIVASNILREGTYRQPRGRGAR